jgi:putative RecB family exonuclease
MKVFYSAKIFVSVIYKLKKLWKTIKSIFVPKIVITPNVFNLMSSCGLKYKFKYVYNLDEILSQQRPEGYIGLLIHKYILLTLKKEIKFDLGYMLSLIMEDVSLKFEELTEEDKKFYEKNVRKMLENFYNWYLQNKDKVYVVDQEITVKYKNMMLRLRCDCILKHNDIYEVVDFVTSKRNITPEFLPYDPTTNFQYFVLEKFFEENKKKFKFIKFFLLFNNYAEFVKNWSVQKEMEKNIIEIYDELKTKEFEAHKGPLCGWCGYYDICPVWKIEREGDEEKGVPPVAPETTLFRVARETPGMMALSYSKMSMYIQCPRRYRLCYLDRVGVKPQGFFSIGSTIHNTLELFYNIKPKKGEPSLEELLNLYSQCWISSGYSSEKEEQEYFESGRQWLINYYNKFVKGQYIPAYATEEYFEIPIGKNKHVMIGYIDRIQKNLDGTFEILDYKTDPKVRTQQEVDSDLQLTIYYWALRNKGVEVKRLGLIFIRFNEIVYTTRTQKDIELLDNYVEEVADSMWLSGEKYMKLKQEYEELGKDIPEEKIEEILPSKINKYCGGCDYLKGCPKEQLIKTEYKDKLLFEVTETGEVIDKEIEAEKKIEEELQTE